MQEGSIFFNYDSLSLHYMEISWRAILYSNLVIFYPFQAQKQNQGLLRNYSTSTCTTGTKRGGAEREREKRLPLSLGPTVERVSTNLYLVVSTCTVLHT